MTDQLLFTLDGKVVVGPAGRNHLAGRPARRHRHPASLLAAAARLSRRRQLSRLHGRDRRRARAGRLLHPQACARHGGEDRDRTCRQGAPHGHGAAARRPAAAGGFARPCLAVLALGRGRSGFETSPLSGPRASSSPTCPIRPWRSISTPASIAGCASAPAAKCRSTT